MLKYKIKRCCAWWLSIFAVGCGDLFPPPPAPLFVVPLEIEGESVGNAIIDTGGDYEVLLRDEFGLEVVDFVDVLVFGGRESVRVTEGFSYTAGGFDAFANGAIVGISSCDCNGIGIEFFRKTGVVAAIGFSDTFATFLRSAPEGGTNIPFRAPPEHLGDFRSSFIDVEIGVNGTIRTLRALLDTGAAETLVKQEFVGGASMSLSGRMRMSISHDRLGTVSVSAVVFNNADLPDIILGTDAMRAWGDKWYFTFTPFGGFVTVFPEAGPLMANDPIAAKVQ